MACTPTRCVLLLRVLRMTRVDFLCAAGGLQEIGYLTSTADELFETILALEGAGGGKSGGASSFDTVVRAVLNDVLERCVVLLRGFCAWTHEIVVARRRLPEEFVMIDMFARAAPLLETKTAPFVLVALQELGRMNGLLFEIRRSLLELRKVYCPAQCSRCRHG